MPTKAEKDAAKAAKAAKLAAKNTLPPDTDPATTKQPEPTAPKVPAGEQVVTMKVTDIQAMIEKAIAQSKVEAVAPLRPKRVKEHQAHVWRLDGKWVVDFVDQNINPETGEKIDMYKKEKVHAWDKFNEQRREFEAWIEIKFHDDSTKKIPLSTYVKNRLLIYCTIIKREQEDLSYSMGEVEKKKEVGDQLVGTGVMIDQIVEMYEETFIVKTPEGLELKIPAYAIA